MVVAALDVLASYSEPPERIARLIDVAFIIVAALQAAVWARELVMGILAQKAGDEPGETSLDNARAVIRVLVSVALFAIAAIVILDNLGVNVTALIAGLGIGGIAIGLAAQGIFSDLFAALSILFDKPFRRGDTISFGTSVVLDQEIRNLAEGQSRRTSLNFGITYQTPTEKLEAIPDLARQAVESRRGCAFVRCAMTGFGPSSLDHELLFDVTTVDPNVLAADRTAIMMHILREFAERKIEFAYPTQTTFTAAPDGKMIMPYATASARR